MIEIWERFISCVPPRKTHQNTVRVGTNRKTGRGHIYTTKDVDDTWIALLATHAPPEPMTGPLCLYVDITWPWNNSDAKRVRHLKIVPHWKRPDLDNVCKALFDAMTTTRWWLDDAQIAELTVCKWRGGEPGIRLALKRCAP